MKLIWFCISLLVWKSLLLLADTDGQTEEDNDDMDFEESQDQLFESASTDYYRYDERPTKKPSTSLKATSSPPPQPKDCNYQCCKILGCTGGKFSTTPNPACWCFIGRKNNKPLQCKRAYVERQVGSGTTKKQCTVGNMGTYIIDANCKVGDSNTKSCKPKSARELLFF